MIYISVTKVNKVDARSPGFIQGFVLSQIVESNNEAKMIPDDMYDPTIIVNYQRSLQDGAAVLRPFGIHRYATFVKDDVTLLVMVCTDRETADYVCGFNSRKLRDYKMNRDVFLSKMGLEAEPSKVVEIDCDSNDLTFELIMEKMNG